MTHMKALASPKALKIRRKEKTWVIRPAPGPHSIKEAIPAGVLLRDILGVAGNKKEVKYILNNKDLLVDGKPVKDEKYPIGLMDIVELPKSEKYYMITVDNNSRLYPKEIDKKASGTKLCKLTNKTVVSSGKIQLNLYDGKNILIDAKDSKKYSVGGTLALKLPKLEISGFTERAVGKVALVAKGRHSGKIGKIDKITKAALNLKSLTTLECDGEKVITDTAYIYVLGDKEPKI